MLARAVMRRDLAVYRAQRATRTKLESAAPKGVSIGTDDASATFKDEDIVMGESSPEEPQSGPPKDDAQQPQADQIPPTDTGEQSPLHIDIPGQDHQAAGHPGDATTGTYSNFDFESLFNDPSSAGAASRESPKDEPPPSQSQVGLAAEADKPANNNNNNTTEPPNENLQKNTMTDQNNDFDFADLTNLEADTEMQDTDGISSLLPGLESYANSDSQPQTTAADFNIFDAAGAGDFGAAPTDNSQAQKPAEDQSQGEHPPEMDNRDTTFDDIMNFTNFDLGDFSAGGDGDGGENKFDASFFDI